MTDIATLIELVKPTVAPDSDVGLLIAELERLRDQEAMDLLDAKVHFLELEKAELLSALIESNKILHSLPETGDVVRAICANDAAIVKAGSK